MKYIYPAIILLYLFSLSGNTFAQQGDKSNYWIYEDFSTILGNEEGSENTEVTIAFTTAGVEIVNPYENKGITIATTGAHVIINSTTEAEVHYTLSGSSTDGSVKIYSAAKFKLLLNGIDLQNPTGPAINIQSKKKATIHLVEGTTGYLADGTNYTTSATEDMKATLFSEGQLSFEGKGSLQLAGNYKHAICSDDYIDIADGTITITTAASDGIHANDYFRMYGGTLNITAAKDGIDCEIDSLLIAGGNINITSTGQGAKAIKSTGNMTLSGGTITLATTGNAYYDTTDLDISSPAGIKCKSNLTIKGNCLLTVTAKGSAGKGINVDGELMIDGGTISVTTSGGQFKYSYLDSAAKAIKSDGNLTINNGNIAIKTSATEAEGLESKSTLTINGGRIEIEAYDDGINAANNITINGGEIYVYSTTNDGIDSNGTLTITGGLVVSSGSTAPEEGFDCDQNTFKITGGTIVGVGGATSTPTSSVCTQRSVVYSASSVTAGQLINISSANSSVLTFKLPRAYSQMTLLFSSPQLAAGTAHTIYSGGSVSGGDDFHGLYTSATYSQGTQAATFTTSSMVTSVGSSTGGNRPGGRP